MPQDASASSSFTGRPSQQTTSVQKRRQPPKIKDQPSEWTRLVPRTMKGTLMCVWYTREYCQPSDSTGERLSHQARLVDREPDSTLQPFGCKNCSKVTAVYSVASDQMKRAVADQTIKDKHPAGPEEAKDPEEWKRQWQKWVDGRHGGEEEDNQSLQPYFPQANMTSAGETPSSQDISQQVPTFHPYNGGSAPHLSRGEQAANFDLPPYAGHASDYTVHSYDGQRTHQTSPQALPHASAMAMFPHPSNYLHDTAYGGVPSLPYTGIPAGQWQPHLIPSSQPIPMMQEEDFVCPACLNPSCPGDCPTGIW